MLTKARAAGGRNSQQSRLERRPIHVDGSTFETRRLHGKPGSPSNNHSNTATAIATDKGAVVLQDAISNFPFHFT